MSPLQVGQTTDLITVRDGVHLLKLVERKGAEQKSDCTSIQSTPYFDPNRLKRLALKMLNK